MIKFPNIKHDSMNIFLFTKPLNLIPKSNSYRSFIHSVKSHKLLYLENVKNINYYEEP